MKISKKDLQEIIDKAVDEKMTALSLSKKVPNDTYKNESDIKESENDIKEEEKVEEDIIIEEEEKIENPTDASEVEKLKLENEMLKKENEKWDKLFNSYSKNKEEKKEPSQDWRR